MGIKKESRYFPCDYCTGSGAGAPCALKQAQLYAQEITTEGKARSSSYGFKGGRGRCLRYEGSRHPLIGFPGVPTACGSVVEVVWEPCEKAD